MAGNETNAPFIDLGETQLCASRGCQGFVLMACSPCVAAERAAAAELRHKEEAALFDEGYVGQGEGEANDGDMGENGDALSELRAELNIEDDALINILGKIVSG